MPAGPALDDTEDDHPLEGLVELERLEWTQQVLAEVRIQRFGIRRGAEDVDDRQKRKGLRHRFRGNSRIDESQSRGDRWFDMGLSLRKPPTRGFRSIARGIKFQDHF
jgi:hypothetical protein